MTPFESTPFAKGWDASKHPRGQPENEGEFSSGGGSSAHPPAAKSPEATIASVVKDTFPRAHLSRQRGYAPTWRVPLPGDRVIQVRQYPEDNLMVVDFFNTGNSAFSRDHDPDKPHLDSGASARELRSGTVDMVRSLKSLATRALGAGLNFGYGTPSDARRAGLYAKVLRDIGYVPDGTYRPGDALHKWVPASTVPADEHEARVREYAGHVNEAGLPVRKAFEPTPFAAARRLTFIPTPFALLKAAAHAPKGGVTIGGTFYRGGEFIPAEVMAGATEEEKAQVGGGDVRTKEKPEDEELPEWDGVISGRVQRDRGWHENQVASWNFYDDDGGHFSQTIALESGEYDPFPDHPDSEPVTVYRWVSYQDGDGYQGDHGHWTVDEEEARADGEEFAEDNNQDEPEPEEEEKQEDKDESDADSAYHEFFSDNAPDPVELCGAPSGARAVLTKSGDAVEIEIRHPQIERCERTMDTDGNGDLFVHNDYFRVKEEYQGNGFGEAMFAGQVEACAAAGVKYIETHAAGHFGSKDFNGYYTWPSFGYDQELNSAASAGPAFNKARATFPDAKSVLDIMAVPRVDLSPEEFADAKKKLEDLDAKLGKSYKERTHITGSDWWKLNGTSLTRAEFDLTPGSRSLAILAARRARAKPVATKSYSARRAKPPATRSGLRSSARASRPLRSDPFFVPTAFALANSPPFALAPFAKARPGHSAVVLAASGLFEWTEFAKARSGLVKKLVTDRNGHQVHRWVRVETGKGSEAHTRAAERGPGDPGAGHYLTRAVRDPSSLTVDDVKALARHLERIPKEGARRLALAMRQRIGGTRAQIADRLLAHVRSQQGADRLLSGRPVVSRNISFKEAGDPGEARSAAAAVLGEDALTGDSLSTLFAAANAHDGATVEAWEGDLTAAVTDRPSFSLDTSGDGYTAYRVFYRDADQKLVCYNASFEVYKDGTGPGAKPVNPNLPRGADLLANQIRALKTLGGDRIETNAAGDARTAKDGGYVGYKVWPKLGYDGPIPLDTRQKMPPGLKEQMGGSNRLSALYATAAGRSWWEEHGHSIYLSFDLGDNSYSMRTLAAYLANRSDKK